MMTTIKTTCKRCGDVKLTPDDVFLTLDVSGKVMVHRFQCPYCAQYQERPVSPSATGALLLVGVRYRVREVALPSITKDEVGAITEDEVGDFAQASEDGRLDDELQELFGEEQS